MVEPAFEIDGVADEVDEEVHLARCPAYDEATADHQWRDDSVACGRTGGLWTASRIRLVKYTKLLTNHQSSTLAVNRSLQI